MVGKGYEVPAGNGAPARVFETPEALAKAGYTAVASQILEAAFGEGGYDRFVAAVGYFETQRQSMQVS